MTDPSTPRNPDSPPTLRHSSVPANRPHERDDQDHRNPAVVDARPPGLPVPEGDVVPGEPPVPITVWYIPRPPDATTAHAIAVSGQMTRRLVANYARRGAVIIDLTTCVPSSLPADATAELVITQWPPAAPAPRTTGRPRRARHPAHPSHGGPVPEVHLGVCVERLAAHGRVAVIVAYPDPPDLLGVLVTAARAHRLTYLQHIVVAHHLPAPPGGRPEDAAVPPVAHRHLRVHTDVLVFQHTGSSVDSPDPKRHQRPRNSSATGGTDSQQLTDPGDAHA